MTSGTTRPVPDVDPALRAAVTAWLAEDPDPVTAAELGDRLAAADGGDTDALAELVDAFSGPLEFGTAGLRGPLGPGPNRMNRVVVMRAAAGLASFVRDGLGLDRAGTGTGTGSSSKRASNGDNGTARRTLVVGYDARRNSAVFARDTADIAAGAGLRAVLLPRALPTPVLAAAIHLLGADAGVMVTASHNPAPDNGYKVYLGDGRQIVPPADADIAARIAAVGALADVPRDPAAVQTPDVDGPDGLLTSYLRRLGVVVGPGTGRDGRRQPDRGGLRLVTTALHGVGAPVLAAALAAAGFTGASPVAAQEQPDPDFPGLPFPNPEEPGVLDAAIAQAKATGADVVLACDPDADRCAVAIPDPADGHAEAGASQEGASESAPGWRRLSGDEVGSLLAWRVVSDLLPPLGGGDPDHTDPNQTDLDHTDLDHTGTGSGTDRTVLVTTIVSSTQLDAIAAGAGAPVAHTLTGFKWLTRAPGLRFAYEEALGYCVDPAAVSDKDGISACLVLADLAARLRAGTLPSVGRTLADLLAHLDAQYGVVTTAQLSIRVARLARRAELLAALAEDPPATLGGLAVESVEDLDAGVDGLPPTPGLRLRLAGHPPTGPDGSGTTDAAAGTELTGRVVVRPSGTEPKLKCYLQVAVPPTGDVTGARAAARTALAAVRADLAARLD